MVRTPDSNAEEKKTAGEAAAEMVRDGMVLGLGTGSTVAWTIKRIGEMVEVGMEVLGVPTSYQAQELAIASGIPLTTLDQDPILDLAIDGVDQISADLTAIKGGGAAHAREKVVASSAQWFVIVADSSKYVDFLSHPVPVEVLPFAARLAQIWIEELGGTPTIRQAKMKDGPVITDNGNFVIDADFGVIEDPGLLAAQLSEIPGVVEHGIFENVDELVVVIDGEVKVFSRV
ncbi:MAG: ribose-5-phosphate isomerase RpiA [Methanothrix sp.]|jgi:ribose 5-phosphate isomerase A|uniref:Ribose-5-phosphate isomerase A n=1 Tax=Methanothrix harundinacea TaxID=301375 RepID=A0A101FSM3_9EURY|nr:MAG: ribose 5-phosphate isomerase [Methanosaeta sp. SDB]KUK43639.1 MAG: Ribose-5-phosphate isomerase A [Methanothrix harundinacea]MDD3710723.1 ribose-5-phosphate isomerase RpiA [Methanothrix sp.]MDI9398188.1 ribose-5-phosphate isomerase RpiA [Euryarchaeota archaeon]KUK96753.1 MAG: Ribose-5-phosphate isomerase A [Methanothrix harundinacea]